MCRYVQHFGLGARRKSEDEVEMNLLGGFHQEMLPAKPID